MANSNKNWISSVYRYKPYLLGALFIASSAMVIGFSQSGLARSNAAPESCDTAGDYSRSYTHFNRSHFLAASTNSDMSKGLFWNPMAKTWLTAEQMDLLQLAYEIGFEDGGHEHAEQLQAILMQETIAGLLGRMGHMTAPVGKRSYGVMQVKVTAARDVLKQFGELGDFRADEELIARLLSDDEFNIRVASKFMLQLKARVKTDERALLAYNLGLGGASRVETAAEYKYVVSTRTYLDEVVRPFNHRFGGEALRLATYSEGYSSGS